MNTNFHFKNAAITRFLLVLLIITASMVSKGQNTGPNAPEAQGFEPIDASNLVNLNTGDFSYVLPLLEVPGPEAGFPVVLSYHAGIGPELEASWVGLGWNVNVGAINRNVNMFPDDVKEMSILTTMHDDGGTQTGTIYDLDIPIPYTPISVNFNWGTNKSLGVNVSMGIGITDAVGAYVTMGTDGNVSLGLGLGGGQAIGKSNFSLNGGIGIGVTSSADGSFSVSGGVSASVGFNAYDKQKQHAIGMSHSIISLGVSSASSGVGISGTLVGYTNTSVQDNYQIVNSSRSIPVIPFIFTITKTKTRWYLHSESEDVGYGVFYSANASKNDESDTIPNRQSPKYSMDVIQTDWDGNSAEENGDKTFVMPGYDQYVIGAQGISGTISPKLFQNARLLGNGVYKKDQEYNPYYYEQSTDDLNLAWSKIQFYMDGSYESYLRNYPGTFNISNPLLPVYNGHYTKQDTIVNSIEYDTYNETTGRKMTGSYVEWIRNADIVANNTAITDFIEADCIRGKRNDPALFDADGIGAINITALDGKVYHFSLPVYQFEQFGRDEKDLKNGVYKDFFDQMKAKKYAYTWLLTAVTGPDYIDVNGNSQVDEADYGYWVKMDYGKWTDGYIWSLPYDETYYKYQIEGEEHRQYTWGRKQIYYLNSIKTKSHTAYFIKSLREDGLGCMAMDSQSGIYGHYLSDVTSKIIDSTWTLTSTEPESTGCDCSYFNNPRYNAITHKTIVTKPKHKVLKLDKIILVKNEDATLSPVNTSSLVINPDADGGKIDVKLTGYKISCRQIDLNCGKSQKKNYEKVLCNSTFRINFQDNVLDIGDLPAGFKEKILKEIEFSYDKDKDGTDDYTLCKNVLNSNAVDKGKLTLHHLQYKGKKGVSYMPAYSFEYNKKDTPVPAEDKVDDWGFYASNTYVKSQMDDVAKPEADTWSLSDIIFPTGGRIKINYESDSYGMEAFGSLKTKLTFDNWTVDYINNSTDAELSIQIPSNVNIDFSKAFTVGGTYRLDLWMQICNFFELMQACAGTTPCRDCTITGSTKNKTYNGYYVLNQVDATNRKIKFTVPKDPSITGTQFVQLNYGSFYTDPFTISYGGGLRVKSLIVTDESLSTTKTEYEYNIPGTAQTSGVTSYAPINTQYRELPYLPFLPPPGVCYSNVAVISYDAKNVVQTRAEYEFETMTPFKVPSNHTDPHSNNVLEVNYMQYDTRFFMTDTTDYYYTSIVIKNSTSAIGRLKSLSLFNSLNHLLTKTTYNYIPRANAGQGVIQETNRFTRVVQNVINKLKFFNSSSQITYPNVLESTVVFQNGITTTQKNDSWDFYTGVPLTQSSISSNGKKYKNFTEKAYEHYASMGPKSEDRNNKNMLVQDAAGYNYLDENGSLIPLAVSAQTWNNDWVYREFNTNYYDQPANVVPANQKVWRKHKAFNWKGDLNANGSLKDFTDSKKFNFTQPETFNTTNGWVKTSEITRYNHYSIPLESKDINGNYISTKLGYNDNAVIATASNANYNSFAYSGFENIDGADWGGEFMGTTGCAQVRGTVEVPSHTGVYYCSMTGNSGPVFTSTVSNLNNGLMENRSYRAMVWMHKNSPGAARLIIESRNSSGTLLNVAEKRKDAADVQIFGEWCLVSVLLDKSFVTNGNIIKTYVYVDNPSAMFPVLIDDQRFQPLDAAVSAYSYDESGMLTAMLDNNNFAAKFEYDEGGRLIRTYKETPQGLKKLSEHSYGYKRPSYFVNYRYSNAVMNSAVSFTANDIGAGANYNWNFGDGGTSAGRTPSHTYNGTSDATFNVQLIATDAKGLQTTINKNVFIDFIPTSNQIEIVKPATNEVISKSERNYQIQWNGFSGPLKIVAQQLFGTYTAVTIVANHTGNAYTWDVATFNLVPGSYSLSISSMDNTISRNQNIVIQ